MAGYELGVWNFMVRMILRGAQQFWLQIITVAQVPLAVSGALVAQQILKRSLWVPRLSWN